MPMLEQDMEVAIANCPELFIEGGLKLIRRQVVIGGRRPDLLFEDAHSRHLLVEIQRGRLDEAHLQRHFYYYYDYRAKYPKTHPRLMFIANRMGSQHKNFLDEHGYEFREFADLEFARKLNACASRNLTQVSQSIEIVTTQGILTEPTYKILYEIERQRTTYCYKMLLLKAMASLSDSDGQVPISSLAREFSNFFINRIAQGKAEENPKRIRSGLLAHRSLSEWERVIRTQPVKRLTEKFLIDGGSSVRWAPRIWDQWNAELCREIQFACDDLLFRYFAKYVPGGY